MGVKGYPRVATPLEGLPRRLAFLPLTSVFLRTFQRSRQFGFGSGEGHPLPPNVRVTPPGFSHLAAPTPISRPGRVPMDHTNSSPGIRMCEYVLYIHPLKEKVVATVQ